MADEKAPIFIMSDPMSAPLRSYRSASEEAEVERARRIAMVNAELASRRMFLPPSLRRCERHQRTFFEMCVDCLEEDIKPRQEREAARFLLEADRAAQDLRARAAELRRQEFDRFVILQRENDGADTLPGMTPDQMHRASLEWSRQLREKIACSSAAALEREQRKVVLDYDD